MPKLTTWLCEWKLRTIQIPFDVKVNAKHLKSATKDAFTSEISSSSRAPKKETIQ